MYSTGWIRCLANNGRLRIEGSAIVDQFFFSFHDSEKNTSRPDAGDEIASHQERSPQTAYDQAACDPQQRFDQTYPNTFPVPCIRICVSLNSRIPASAIREMKTNYSEQLPKTMRLLTADLNQPRSTATRTASAPGPDRDSQIRRSSRAWRRSFGKKTCKSPTARSSALKTVISPDLTTTMIRRTKARGQASSTCISCCRSLSCRPSCWFMRSGRVFSMRLRRSGREWRLPFIICRSGTTRRRFSPGAKAVLRGAGCCSHPSILSLVGVDWARRL